MSNFAEEVYSGRSRRRLKEVLGDLIGNVDGAEVAKAIGESLAGAVKDAHAWPGEVLGPDELPAKFRRDSLRHRRS